MNTYLFLYYAYKTRKWHDPVAIASLGLLFIFGMLFYPDLPAIFFGIAFMLFVAVGMCMGASVVMVAYVKKAIKETAEEDGLSVEEMTAEFLADMKDEGDQQRMSKKAARAARTADERESH